MAMTDAEKKRAQRKRLREAGFVLKQIWIHPDDWEPIRDRIERANLKRRESGVSESPS